MARRFRFRLETLRKLREQARDAQRRVVAEKVRALGQVEGRIAQLMHEYNSTADRSREVQQLRPLNIVFLRGHQLYRGWLRRRVAESHTERDEKNAAVAAERAKLAEASKQLRVIEMLRERQWTRYRIELAREEQAASDEAALQMYLRRERRTPDEVRA